MGKLQDKYEAFIIRLGIWYGSRCPNDGVKYNDVFEDTGWPRMVCPKCGHFSKY